ncbi:MAG: FecR family protein [Elusimicrobiota bacterium]
MTNTRGSVPAGARRSPCALAVLAALAVLSASAAAPAPAAAASKGDIVAGVVIDVKGKPMVRRGGEGKFRRLKLNKFVYDGDLVKTGAGERAAIAFIGGAEMRINESSEFLVESGGGRSATSVFSRAGQIWTRLLHGRAGMQVRTPLAVASVRGTEADVDIQERMTVKVYEGHVDVSNDHGRQSLQAGMTTQVAGAGQAPQPARKLEAGEYGSWQDALSPKDVDKKLKRLHEESGRTRMLKLKYKGKGGEEKELNLRLKKKK